MKLIKINLESYKPEGQSARQLADDWRQVAAKYSTMKAGGKTEFSSLSDLVKFSKALFVEIKKRGKITFHPEKMQPNSRELFDFTSGLKKFEAPAPAPVEPCPEPKPIDRNSILATVEDFVVIPDFLSLVGSVVEKSDFNDIDYCYKMECSDPSVELNFRNLFSKELRSKLHPIPNIRGPHGNNIPIYDLVARRKPEFNLVQIGKQESKTSEIRAQILAASPVKGSPRDFVCNMGYALDGSKPRTGLNIVSAGEVVCSVNASKGAILILSVEGVIPVEVEPGKYGVSFVSPKVKGIEINRKTPESTKEIIYSADASGTLQADSTLREKLKALKLVKLEKVETEMTIKEGDEGEVVFQVHERGLSEEQINASNTLGIEPIKLSPAEIGILNAIKKADWGNLADKDSGQISALFAGIDKKKLTPEQLKTLSKVEPVSIHTDFRMRVNGWNFWEGGEGFTPGNQYGPNKFIEANSNPEIKILGAFKAHHKSEGGAEEGVRGPLSWMEIGLKAPVVIMPGEVGATSNAFARITAIEKLKFKAGVQDKHFKEFYFYGDKIKGRWIFSFVPTGPRDRQWMISKPGDQEMKSTDFKKERKLFKDEKKQIVYGIVYEPLRTDTDGDYATAEEIEKACHKFLEDYNQVSLMHKSLIDDRAKVVENYIAPQDMIINGEKIPKGSWVMATHILDRDLWQKIVKGELDAYSIEGTGLAGNPISYLEPR